MEELVERPWFVWLTEYPDEGSVVVQAATPEGAEAFGRRLLCGDEASGSGEDPTEVSAKPVTADDVAKLQDRVEEQQEALNKVRAAITKAAA